MRHRDLAVHAARHCIPRMVFASNQSRAPAGRAGRSCRGTSCYGACWTTESTAARTGEVTDAVRITHPFHPLFGQELDFVVQRHRWGEDRVYYRDRDGHQASLPACWTSVIAEDLFVTVAAGRSPFRVEDLVALVTLLQEIHP